MKQFLLLLVEAAIRNIPGAVGRKLRYWYYRRRLGSCGRRVVIDRNVVFQNPGSIFVGNDVWFDQGVIVMAGKASGNRKIHVTPNVHYRYEPGELHIGDQVHIAPQVILQAHGGISIGSQLTIAAGSKLYSLSHHYRNVGDNSDQDTYYFGSMVPANQQFLIQGAIVVGDRAAVGLNCILLPGTCVPDDTWLGAGIIVQAQSLKPASVYSVQQQHIIKKRKQ